MKVRLSDEAREQVIEMSAWWVDHRDKAPDLCDRELADAFAKISEMPTWLPVYQRRPSGDVRRVLMPKTRNHVYYLCLEGEVLVIAVDGGPKGREPAL